MFPGAAIPSSIGTDRGRLDGTVTLHRWSGREGHLEALVAVGAGGQAHADALTWAWSSAATAATCGAAADVPLALAGFSFGTFVAARTACALVQAGIDPAVLVLAGTAAGKWPMPTLPVTFMPS